ncbi:hypothetical protein QN277_021681 [Acacia crassicarpa]|uniref:Uncharacterized protein n=1 Tax=Acacia crassicarpa TaxID=499986 RepID=A0AAE1JQQ7_9FABA|nr:hypothetical protein QN277_021681 [Acacia crassicarpa]
MEAHQTQRITNKEQRNKTAPIAGLLVFGGALAVTGVIAIASFATKRSKAKPPPHEPQQSECDHPSVQHSSTNHDNACYTTSYTAKDQVLSCESLPSQTSILEDKPDLKVETYVEEDSTTSLHQEIVLSDDSPPESTASFNDNETGLEGQEESSADSPCLEELDQSEPQEPLKSVEINEGQHDNDSAATETEDDIVEEDNSVGFERSENSSEATGRTSLNSSEAVIWPAELIEEEPQQVKGQMANEQSESEGTAESNISGTDDKSHSGANVFEFSGYPGNDKVMASAKASPPEEVDQSEPQEPLKSVEINEGQHDNDSATTKTEDDIVEEDDGVGFERSENSSGATGMTSLNSSEAAIWPAELIEEEPQQVKGQMANEQSEAKGTAELNISRTDNKSHSGANVSEFSGCAGNDKVMASAKASSSEKPNLYAALNNHLTIFEFKTWTILLLLFAILLLVLLTHRNGMSGSLTVAIL